MLKSIKVLESNVSATNLKDAALFIEECITAKKKVYVCVAPVSTIVDAHADESYREVINNAAMITPDGMPLVWLGKMKGEQSMERTYGPDLMLRVCGDGQDKGYRHFFYGGTENTCGLLKNVLKEKFSKIDIRGHYAPPIRPTHTQEDQKIIDQINESSADILWVGLGSPKQDFWMHEHREKLNVPVIIGVGAAFDFIAGTKRQAPVWMRNVGLEWFFRLCSEPRRLWKRYLVGNTRFIYLLIRYGIKAKIGHRA